MPYGSLDGVAIGTPVKLLGAPLLAPDNSWIGSVLDPFGNPMDGSLISTGAFSKSVHAPAPLAHARQIMGERLETGVGVIDTFLPLAKGQRIGLFAGSGVGKSTLLGRLAKNVPADVTVIALIGERGRELQEFIQKALGPEGMARSIIVAATSDMAPNLRRRAAWTAMAIAEHFRDQGAHVLFLADSLTRFAEAYREVAVSAGEEANMRGFPPSLTHALAALSERAGPGEKGQGMITAVMSVHVAGSDMEEPVADILRGLLDGHILLSREIAERGRYPAIDVLRSVSRSLPDAATDTENTQLTKARRLLGAYDRAEMMVQAGLYQQGSDPLLDQAITALPKLEAFFGEGRQMSIEESFEHLVACLPN
jgi:flagellum-specific ATP synthase